MPDNVPLLGESASEHPGVRAVNGDGQRCGCGALSRLRIHYHRTSVVAASDAFLCSKCVGRAVESFLTATGQERYGEAATEEYRA
jgi:hypothetical protein